MEPAHEAMQATLPHSTHLFHERAELVDPPQPAASPGAPWDVARYHVPLARPMVVWAMTAGGEGGRTGAVPVAEGVAAGGRAHADGWRAGAC
eukprot:335530-Chlamydomonas_euryale.AAC.1